MREALPLFVFCGCTAALALATRLIRMEKEKDSRESLPEKGIAGWAQTIYWNEPG